MGARVSSPLPLYYWSRSVLLIIAEGDIFIAHWCDSRKRASFVTAVQQKISLWVAGVDFPDGVAIPIVPCQYGWSFGGIEGFYFTCEECGAVLKWQEMVVSTYYISFWIFTHPFSATAKLTGHNKPTSESCFLQRSFQQILWNKDQMRAGF